jgi:hypothetical protein
MQAENLIPLVPWHSRLLWQALIESEVAVLNYSQKIWSPNSPFGKEHSVFSGREAASLCGRGKARAVSLADAMATLTERLEPLRWSDEWLVKQFLKMGMPRSLRKNTLVLIFQGQFSENVKRVFKEEVDANQEDRDYNQMVDTERNPQKDGRVGMGVWTNRPTMRSKLPGGPVVKTQQLSIRFRKTT